MARDRIAALLIAVVALGVVVYLRRDQLREHLAEEESAKDQAGFDPYTNDVEQAEEYEDWYPDDITPPPGTQYPCALTALPEDLPGIPNMDRGYINHVYSQILECTQAKLLLLKAFSNLDWTAAAAAYDAATAQALERIRAETVPEGLSPFQDDVIAAIELQREYFERLDVEMTKAIRDGRALGDPHKGRAHVNTVWKRAFKDKRGKQASGKLHAAWAKMRKRYGKHWPKETQESIYHHLCALDLY